MSFPRPICITAPPRAAPRRNVLPPNRLRNGWGAGNKNSCVLRAGKDIGWEKLDMTKFLLDDAQFNGNGQTKMIYQPVEGQTI
jgi:hypothetical protein